MGNENMWTYDVHIFWESVRKSVVRTFCGYTMSTYHGGLWTNLWTYDVHRNQEPRSRAARYELGTE